MPINRQKMKTMKKTYGSKKGEKVYYAMENKTKKKPKGYSKGGMVHANCGASMKPNGKAKR